MSAFVDAPIEPRSVTRSRHVFTNAVSSTRDRRITGLSDSWRSSVRDGDYTLKWIAAAKFAQMALLDLRRFPLLILELPCARLPQKINLLCRQKTSRAVAVYQRVIERDIRAAPRHELCPADRSEDSPCPRLTLLRADHFRG